MTAHVPADPTLEAIRIQRDAYVASGGQAAVIYDTLRDELAATKRRLSDQEEMLRAAKRDPPKTTAANEDPREAGEAAEAKL
jgi:hypothetical protein